MATTSIIITAGELTTFLRYPVSDPVPPEAAALAEQVALGWLSDVTDVTDWEQHTDDLGIKAWVLELAGMAYENPTSMTQDQAGEVASSWQRDRRSQILESARAWAVRKGPAPAVTTSRGSFPPAAGWPDPAQGRW